MEEWEGMEEMMMGNGERRKDDKRRIEGRKDRGNGITGNGTSEEIVKGEKRVRG